MNNRKSHWEHVYATKSPLEVSWYQTEPTMSLKLIGHAAPGSDTAIIDVGGGASVLVDRLLERGFHRLAVLDISSKAMAYTRQRLGDVAKDVEWYEADVTTFDPPHQFGIWHDRAVFHFLTDNADRRLYLEVLKKSLAPGGQAIIGAFAIGGPTKCSGLDIVQYDGPGIAAALGSEFELLEEEGERHRTPAGGVQEFNFFRLRRR